MSRETESSRSNVDTDQLYIVGFNIDAKRAWWHKKNGSLLRVSEGVYIDSGLTAEERKVVLEAHSVRITHLCRPYSILCGASAYHHTAVGGYVSVCKELSMPHKQVAGGFDIYNVRFQELPVAAHRIYEMITVKDSLGELKVRCMTDEMMILESFTTVRSRPAVTTLNMTDLAAVIDRAFLRHKSVEILLAKLESLSEITKHQLQFRKAENHIRRVFKYQQTKENIYDYTVLWNRHRVASLQFDGSDWTFKYEKNFRIPLTLAKGLGDSRVPSFIASLLPESKLREREEVGDGFKEFSIADRYASNITVRKPERAMERVIVDTLEGELKDFSDQFLVFTGSINDGYSIATRDEDSLHRVRRHAKTPRTSGMQAKVPVNIDMNGVLSVAQDKSFTHIAKLSPRDDDMSSMGSIEWYTMTLAAVCGVDTERFAIADLGGASPSFIAERFDIRRNLNDNAMILTEDMWSVMGLVKNSDKYDADLMRVANIVKDNSTNPDEDTRKLFRQVAFSWLAGNSDMHLKNLMMIKEANDDFTGFKSIRLSPAYDMVCTQVYPDDDETAALKLGGNGMYTAAKLKDFGRKMKIDSAECETILKDVILRISHFGPMIAGNLPPLVSDHERSVEHIHKALFVMSTRCGQMVSEIDGATPRRRLNLVGKRQSTTASFCA